MSLTPYVLCSLHLRCWRGCCGKTMKWWGCGTWWAGSITSSKMLIQQDSTWSKWKLWVKWTWNLLLYELVWAQEMWKLAFTCMSSCCFLTNEHDKVYCSLTSILGVNFRIPKEFVVARVHTKVNLFTPLLCWCGRCLCMWVLHKFLSELSSSSSSSWNI